MNHILSVLETYSLTPIVWEVMPLEWDLKSPTPTVIQTWYSASSLAKVVEKGHRALFGPCKEWYLDCGSRTFIDPKDSRDPDSAIKYPYRDWCAPYKDWRQILFYDSLADISEDEKCLVVGREVHLWAQLTDGVNSDGMLWPRAAAAAAEVLWRGKGEVG